MVERVLLKKSLLHHSLLLLLLQPLVLHFLDDFPGKSCSEKVRLLGFEYGPRRKCKEKRNECYGGEKRRARPLQKERKLLWADRGIYDNLISLVSFGFCDAMANKNAIIVRTLRL